MQEFWVNSFHIQLKINVLFQETVMHRHENMQVKIIKYINKWQIRQNIRVYGEN